MATSIRYAPYSNWTLADFKGWAQTIGQGIEDVGWVRDTTANGIVNWNTIKVTPLIWYQYGVRQSSLLPALNFTSTYLGAWSNAGVSYTANNSYVTYDGATWICISSYTTNSSSPPPGYEFTGTIHWVPWFFEVFRSTGSPTIYLRVDYSGCSGRVDVPRLRIIHSTSIDSNANMGTAVGAQAGWSDVNAFTQDGGTTSVPNGTMFPCYFSGDGTNRLSLVVWGSLYQWGNGASSFNGCGFFGLERSLSSTGTYYTTPGGGLTPYYMAIWAGYNNSKVTQCYINTTGSTWIKTTAETVINTLCVDWGYNNTNITGGGYSGGGGNISAMGNPPAKTALPIWPLVGWVGNPLTMCLSYKGSDANGWGTTFTQTMYGQAHTYLAIGWQGSSFGQFGTSANDALAIRWE